MKQVISFLIFVVFTNILQAQSVYITSSGGSFPTEKWMSITTGVDGTGIQVWGQGNGTYGNGQGLLSDVSVDLSGYCGQTLYINAFDRFDDGWDGTTYTVYDGAGSSGNLLASNGGLSPDSGDDNDCNTSNWCTSDPFSELESSESFLVPSCPCNSPNAAYSIISDCINGQFSVEVNLTNLGDASAVDITDGTTTFENNVGIGTYVLGPFAAGSNQVINVLGSLYGGCDINSTSLTEACICSVSPQATVAGINLNCNTFNFDIEVTTTSFGDGTSAEIWIDGVLVEASAVLLNSYIFSNYTAGQHTVEIKSFGGAFVTCESSYSISETCNGAEVCSNAPDISNTCQSGDLNGAIVDGGALVENYISCGNGNTIALCGANAGFTGSSYSRTDHADIWYKVFPNGSNQVTIDITNLSGGNLMILPYLTNGTCPSLASDNTTLEGHIGNGGITGSSCPYFSADGSLVLSGPDVAAANTIYLRIMAYANNGSGATNCQTLTYPTFDICTSIPQANDICNDAIDIDGVSSTGNFCQANIDSESNETCNIGSGCNACGIASESNDLWYSVTMNPGDDDQNLEVIMTFQNATDAAVVTLYSGCFSNSQLDDAGVADCAVISSTGVGSVVSHTFLSAITEGGAGPDWYIRVAPLSGNAICEFDIEANRIAENNDCALFQNVFPGFNIENPQLVNFNYSSDSQALPAIVGNDLWYYFNPNTGIDNGIPVYSTSADLLVSGLQPGEEIEVLVYQGEGVTANNCSNLASNFQTSISITSNGLASIDCLDEIHGPTDGGYLVRIVQVAGAAAASPTVTITPSLQTGKYNNSCINIWDGNSPNNLGVSDAAHEFNPYYILNGETISGDFSGTTDCDAEITSSLCSGLSNDPFSDVDQRDLWYIFSTPSGNCPSLSASSVVDNMDITYDASNGSRDAKLYVYSNCGDGDLIACSPTLDGNGDTWTVTGLNQGEYYLLRVKPNSLNSDFDYSFDLSINEGAARPCNNEGINAESIPVNSCNSYSSLATYSMQGADESVGAGVLENDVWFTFTAPSPANGGPYFNSNKSWVTVFLENTSGTSSGPLTMELYSSPSSIVIGASSYSSGSSAGSQGFAQFGHLNPGQVYYIRVFHKEGETTAVDYKLNVYTPNANEIAWSCGNNSASLSSTCSEGCNDLREAYFKIDLPVGTPSNSYYMIEVVGEDQILDFELRSQFLSESSALEGAFNDFDLPCSSRPLEPGVSMVSETLGVTTPTTGETCNLNGIAADGGEGVRRVYFGMNGPAAGMKDYYFIKVFMDPSDPNYNSTEGLNICTINFNGPYSTLALADAGGSIDVNCSVTSLGVELVSFDGESIQDQDVLVWETSSELNNSHFVIEQSRDGEVFSPIGEVLGNGTSNTGHKYQFEHQRNSSKNYYRLKQFDFDGSMTMSNVIYLESIGSEVNIYPNPIAHQNTFTISAANKITGWEIRNSLGMLINKREGIQISTTTIAGINDAGLYLVTVFMGNKKVVKRLIVR